MKQFLVYGMGVFYILAGINHFLSPEFYLRMIPELLPYPEWINWISGLAEVLLGLGVFLESTRKWACLGIAVLLVLVFPANIKMLLDAWGGGSNIPVWALVFRLPVQFLFLYWTLWVKEIRFSR